MFIDWYLVYNRRLKSYERNHRCHANRPSSIESLNCTTTYNLQPNLPIPLESAVPVVTREFFFGGGGINQSDT